MINFQFSPRSQGITEEMKHIIDSFKEIESILSDGTQRVSNDVLALIRPHLEVYGYKVEKGKSKENKIDVPVLFGENNVVDKFFSLTQLVLMDEL